MTGLHEILMNALLFGLSVRFSPRLPPHSTFCVSVFDQNDHLIGTKEFADLDEGVVGYVESCIRDHSVRQKQKEGKR